MNENVKKVLEEQLWYVATCGDEPNVVPMGFKKVMGNRRTAGFISQNCGDVLLSGYDDP